MVGIQAHADRLAAITRDVTAVSTYKPAVQVITDVAVLGNGTPTQVTRRDHGLLAK